MDNIIEMLKSADFNLDTFWKAALILLAGTFLMSTFGRFVFGKRSALNNATSSAIAILFIYAVTVVLRSIGTTFSFLITPLPYVSISGESLELINFSGMHYTAICSEVFNLIILSFLVNLIDGFLPKGKGIFSWLIFRILTVVIAFALHIVVVGLFATYLPDVIVTYAPFLLLCLLLVMLLTGALKILVGAALTTVNPIIGGLYTFFFANIVGKQVTKAVLTTAILTAIVFGLRYVGVGIISIASAALIAYIPIMLILIVIWFIVYKFF